MTTAEAFDSSAAKLLSLFSSAAIWRGNALFSQAEVVSTRFAALDAALPGGGWPCGALTELLHEEDGIGEMSLLLPSLAAMSAQSRVALVAPPHLPYAPALVQAKVNLANLILVQPDTDDDAWWSAEQLMRSGQFKMVLFWPDAFNPKKLRRLNTACESGKTVGMVWHNTSAAQQTSPAPLRLLVQAGVHANESEVHVLKRRGSLLTEAIRLRFAEVSTVPVLDTLAMQASQRSSASPTNPAFANRGLTTVSRARMPFVRSVRSDRTPSQRYALRNVPRVSRGSQLLQTSEAPHSSLVHQQRGTQAVRRAHWPVIAASADTLKLSTTPDR